MDHSAAVLVAKYLCIGFSGARKPAPASLTALKWLSRHVPPQHRCNGGLCCWIGCGLPCLVFLPPGISAPAGWGLQAISDGWQQHQPPTDQLSLFK